MTIKLSHTRVFSSPRLSAIAATIAIAIAATSPVAHASSATALADFSDLVEQVSPAVVNIEAIHNGNPRKQVAIPEGDDQMPDIFRRFFGNPQMPAPGDDAGTAIGTGFLISSDGKILTNNHVVEGADRVIVHMSDRREFTAKILGRDPLSDVALLKVDATGLPFLTAAPAKSLKAGQWVVAIGSPFGLDHSVTAGIVSAVGRRSLDQSQQYVPFIQTDVPINRGNSGGPLLNTKGEVVGINSQIFSSSGGYMGVSFAIPIETAMNSVTQLQATGKVRRGILGVRVQEVTTALAQAMHLPRTSGALVAGIEPGSAAEKAGIKVGDLITSFNGTEIGSSTDLPPLVGSLPPGTRTELGIQRNGKALRLPVVLDNLGDSSAAAKLLPAVQKDAPAVAAQHLGLSVQDMSPEQRKALKLDAGQGVLVTGIKGEVARRSGVQPGDVILRVGSHDVGSVASFASAASQTKTGDSVMLLVRRDDQTQFIALGPIEKG